MTTYTKDQIKRVNKLMDIMFPDKIEKPDSLWSTTYGVKTNTGLLNLILSVMFDKE